MGVETQQLIKKIKSGHQLYFFFFPFQMKSFCHEVPDVVLNIYVVVRIPSLSFLWCIWNEFLVASFFLVAKAAAGGLELLKMNLQVGERKWTCPLERMVHRRFTH
jgi:hypothetical protein